MNSLLLASFLVVLVGPASDRQTQESPLKMLERAASFNNTGQFRKALALADTLLGSDDPKLDDAPAGLAWNIRGLALQNLCKFDEARRSYESAIKLLRPIPAQTVQYATALDDLGSLEADYGQLTESKALRIRAKELYDSAGDPAGAARAASSLVIVTLAMGSRKEARHYMAEAKREEALVKNPDKKDLAWTLGAECLLEEADGRYLAAMDGINRLIGMFTQQYGPRYYLLGSTYFVRGRLYQILADDSRAADDLQRSLSILSDNDEQNSKVYFLAQMTYAKSLRNLGRKGDASQLESGAQAGLEHLRHQQCPGCTVSVEGLR